MSKFRLLGLSLVAMAMVAFADCKGNKTGDEASNNDSDTMLLPTQAYGDLISDEIPTAEETTNNGVEQVMVEDQNGSLSQASPETVNSNSSFYIVAGSFTLYSNAQKLNEKLKQKGFDSKILPQFGQYNRVTVKEFSTVEEARAALPGLRGQIDQTLWLLTR